MYCESCSYFIGVEELSTVGPSIGECRRRAPSVAFSSVEAAASDPRAPQVTAFWPTVFAEDRCGEYASSGGF